MPARHPDVVREQVARLVTIEDPVGLGKQLVDRGLLASDRFGPRLAG